MLFTIHLARVITEIALPFWQEELWLADMRYVRTVSRPDAPIDTGASFVVEDGRTGALSAHFDTGIYSAE